MVLGKLGPVLKKEVKSTLAMGAILTLAQAAGLEDYVLYFMIILEVVTLLQYVYNYFQGNPNPNAPKMSDMLLKILTSSALVYALHKVKRRDSEGFVVSKNVLGNFISLQHAILTNMTKYSEIAFGMHVCSSIFWMAISI